MDMGAGILEGTNHREFSKVLIFVKHFDIG